MHILMVKTQKSKGLNEINEILRSFEKISTNTIAENEVHGMFKNKRANRSQC